MTDSEEPEMMEREEFGSLECWFMASSALRAPGREGAEQLCKILKDVGGIFVRTEPGSKSPTWETDPAPAAKIDSKGGLSSVDFSHPLLSRTVLEPTSFRTLPPTCSLSYRPALRLVTLSQSGSGEEPENLDALARGQLALARKLFPRLRPKLAFIDEVSDSLDEQKVLVRPLRKSLHFLRFPYIFWANFWSRAYVEKFGPDLLIAPGWVKRKLPGRNFLYVATKSFSCWWTRPPAIFPPSHADRFPL